MTDTHTTHFPALSIGLFAQQMLASTSTATIIGSTSRGLFLLIPEQRIVFLSYETWRGPLTVNLGQSSPLLQKLSTGTHMLVSAEQIQIPNPGIILNLRSSPVWSASPVPHSICTPEERQAKLQAVAELACAQTNSGFSPVLAHFQNVPDRVSLDQAELSLLERLLWLRQALSQQEFAEASMLAVSLLGYGRGLTPSGDDLIAGLLLTLNRWGLAFPIIPDTDALASFNHHITSDAYAKTTALSANIIAASASGQADERLIQSLDALFSNQMHPPEIATLLLGYGATSGMDTLTGFALAISTIPL
jgi:hypothetical protein